MSEILRAVVSAVPGDPEGMQVTLQTDATTLDILIGLAAVIREIWREFAEDDPESADLLQEALTGALTNPSFWTREEEGSS